MTIGNTKLQFVLNEIGHKCHAVVPDPNLAIVPGARLSKDTIMDPNLNQLVRLVTQLGLGREPRFLQNVVLIYLFNIKNLIG